MSKAYINMNTNAFDENYAKNLVKVVTIDEWNALQSSINILAAQVSMLNGKLNTNKQEEINHDKK